MASLDSPSASTASYRAATSFEPPLNWSAILAGAAVSLAVSVTLTTVATGLGLHFATLGESSRAASDSFTPEVGAYAVAGQVIAAGLGGYLAGRMRHVWLSAHEDEAHFRDTAHGLIAWAVATLAGLLLAAVVFGPSAEVYAAHAALTASAPTAAQAERAANIATQSAFFLGVGLVLSAFMAAVAARIGGQRTEAMHARGVA